MVYKRYDIRLSGYGDISGFIARLVREGVTVSALSVSNGKAVFRTDRHGVVSIRRLRKRYRLKVSISISGRDDNSVKLFSSYRFIIACFIPFACSFFLWQVEVDSDMPEVIERIEAKLESASITKYQPLAFLPDEGEIRRELMLNDPTLSWVRFRKIGTSLTIIPMLSPPSDTTLEPAGPPSDLIARTSGVISRFELTKGERVGHIHQTVKKGDILATGILEQGNKKSIVGAEGAVFADYWVEYSFHLPKVIDFYIQGEEQMKFEFYFPWKNIGEIQWNEILDEDTSLPFIKSVRYVEEDVGQLELAEGMEETVIIPLLKHKLLSEPSSNKMIKDEKILHVTFDNDKVSGTILFLINDNIAIKRPISQGEE